VSIWIKKNQIGGVSYTLGRSRAAYRNFVIKQCEMDNLEDMGVDGGQY
jgi:hypothetical protein